ncbi:MAG: hypothetical protein OES24_05880 [Acidimicrobiia bacterium]|nr:hypothetical protein [Acidimicrobiia bacterium]
MRYRWLTGLVALTLIASASGCSSSSSQWAEEARAWHGGLREGQIAEGGSVFAVFLSPDVVWDHRANFVGHADIHHGGAAISHAAWALGPASLRMESDIFISVDGLVWFYIYDYAPLGFDYLPEPKHHSTV